MASRSGRLSFNAAAVLRVERSCRALAGMKQRELQPRSRGTHQGSWIGSESPTNQCQPTKPRCATTKLQRYTNHSAHLISTRTDWVLFFQPVRRSFNLQHLCRLEDRWVVPGQQCQSDLVFAKGTISWTLPDPLHFLLSDQKTPCSKDHCNPLRTSSGTT